MSDHNYKVIWDESLKQIFEDYSSKGLQDEFKIWFNMTYVKDTINEITVSVPSDFMWSQMISRGYVKDVEEKIKEICGQTVSIKYILKNKSSADENSKSEYKENTETENVSQINSNFTATERVPNYSRNLKADYFTNSINELKKNSDILDDYKNENNESESNSSKSAFRKHPLLDDKHTFESFVQGENSEYAYNASLAAAKDPGKSFNPLLIYGGVGLGKTHLMEAIGNYIYNNSENKDKIKICYISAENFTNEFTKSIRDKKMENFKSKYRNLDVLLLDDIHFIMGKEGVQEELFHTFEALSHKKAQMVFTCDRPLSELKDISARLKSRFSLGTPIDLQPPNYETRKAIILKKIDERKQEDPNTPNVPPEVIDLIAKNIQSNVRDLESAIKNIIGYSSLTLKPITPEITQSLLKDLFLQNTYTGSIRVDTIQKIVANHYNLSISDLKSKKRNQKFVIPRNIAIYITRELGDYSYPEIGEEFGGRNHTTIMHSYENICDQIKIDPTLKATIELLTKDIKEFKKD